MIADVVVDLQYGDCGKGKIAHALCSSNNYTHVIRYNGGCNAGHTIYHDGEKFITHHIPCGVFYGIKSIIGPGCVVHVDTFLKEVEELEEKGVSTKDLLFISTNAHIITDFHRAEDKKDEEIGTTKRGNGPAYRDKYARKGVRAFEDPRLQNFLIDLYEELYEDNDSEDIEILFEGAQGFGLDIDWGDYPYVTSSHCTVGSAVLNGVSPKSIRDIWGVAKIYETYVGAKKFEGEDPIFEDIREIGQEFGSTTGRPRQINWLDFDMLKMASRINGANNIVFNKMDVLENV
ncbi:MAG TPA: adenylosuccinate synthase, partial [Maribacter sp.]|nr:adenylosuccinate synthase [Maribacter sp.]